MLYLASASPSRRYLLELAHIPYHAVGHSADETVCDWGLPLEKLVCSIAQHKMAHALVPLGRHERETMVVLAADTLSMDTRGIIHGKPTSRQDAYEKIRALRAGSRVCTAFCLDKKQWQNRQWITTTRIMRSVSAECIFDVPDESLGSYIDNSPALQASGGIAIEGYGLQFLKSVTGSYSTILGLPLYELRQALAEVGFSGPV